MNFRVCQITAISIFGFLPTALAQSPVQPLDGRTTPISAAVSARQAGTVIRVIREGQVLKSMTTKVTIKLPPSVLVNESAGRKRLNLVNAEQFVIDPDKGEWYSLIEKRDGYDLYTEGDNRLVTASNSCTLPGEQNVFLGSTTTLPQIITDREAGPKKEILIVSDCVPYRAVLECAAAKGCNDIKAKLSNVYMSQLVNVRKLDIPEAVAPRALVQTTAGPIVQSERDPNESPTKFRYKPPGETLIRQYTAPPYKTCGVAVGAERTIDRTTPYSRLVLAGPEIMKRFPVALKASQKSVANSQIFSRGGSFLASRAGRGILVEDLECTTPVSFDGRMGTFDDPTKYYEDNFNMPWADTFCEWRNNAYTQPFCAASNGHAMTNAHFGVDLRAWNTSMSDDVPIVSVSDGVVVEVASKSTGVGNEKWEGFVVKIRSDHLIFVYRHMNPEKSPFKSGVANQLKLGDRVAAGQLLGYMGRFLVHPTGTTKHLHFEIEAPVPKAVLLGDACVVAAKDKNGVVVKIRTCSAREKAPAYPSLIVSYLNDRFNKKVDLSKIDRLTGLPTLPVMQEHEEITPANARISSR